MAKRKIQWQGREIEVTSVGFNPAAEPWNEFYLNDGTTLRLKVVVTEIFRGEGVYDAEGNPLYIVRSQNVLSCDANESLRKKPGDADAGGEAS